MSSPPRAEAQAQAQMHTNQSPPTEAHQKTLNDYVLWLKERYAKLSPSFGALLDENPENHPSFIEEAESAAMASRAFLGDMDGISHREKCREEKYSEKFQEEARRITREYLQTWFGGEMRSEVGYDEEVQRITQEYMLSGREVEGLDLQSCEDGRVCGTKRVEEDREGPFVKEQECDELLQTILEEEEEDHSDHDEDDEDDYSHDHNQEMKYLSNQDFDLYPPKPPSSSTPTTNNTPTTPSTPSTTATAGTGCFCVVCYNPSSTTVLIECPCSDLYCRPCLSTMFRHAMKNENAPQFPPRCCKKEIPVSLVMGEAWESAAAASKAEEGIFSLLEVMKFDVKMREYQTPGTERIYCCRQECGAFIPPAAVDLRARVATCNSCGIGGGRKAKVCVDCRGEAHPGEKCGKEEGEDEEALGDGMDVMLEELVKRNQWKRCGGCRAVIERDGGCSHVVCRCGSAMCYACGRPWQTCKGLNFCSLPELQHQQPPPRYRYNPNNPNEPLEERSDGLSLADLRHAHQLHFDLWLMLYDEVENMLDDGDFTGPAYNLACPATRSFNTQAVVDNFAPRLGPFGQQPMGYEVAPWQPPPPIAAATSPADGLTRNGGVANRGASRSCGSRQVNYSPRQQQQPSQQPRLHQVRPQQVRNHTQNPQPPLQAPQQATSTILRAPPSSLPRPSPQPQWHPPMAPPMGHHFQGSPYVGWTAYTPLSSPPPPP